MFEFTSDALGAQSGVGGGGRYDGLVEELGGPPTPGIGWAAGVERILLAGERRRRAHGRARAARRAELFVALEDHAPRLRGRRLRPAQPGALGGAVRADGSRRTLAERQLGHADALGARYVAIVGERQTVLKDMQPGGQEPLATNAVVHAVLRGHHAL